MVPRVLVAGTKHGLPLFAEVQETNDGSPRALLGGIDDVFDYSISAKCKNTCILFINSSGLPLFAEVQDSLDSFHQFKRIMHHRWSALADHPSFVLWTWAQSPSL